MAERIRTLRERIENINKELDQLVLELGAEYKNKVEELATVPTNETTTRDRIDAEIGELELLLIGIVGIEESENITLQIKATVANKRTQRDSNRDP